MDYVTIIGMGSAFVLGGLLASGHYEQVIKEEMLKQSEVAQKRLEEVRDEERASAEKLTAAVDQRDSAVKEIEARERTIRNLLDGMRNDVHANAVSAAKPDTCQSERRAVVRCKGFLRESAELLAESSEKLERNAVTHDALVKVIE